MHRFITRFLDRVTGVLSGFDRLVFRGWLRPLCYESGMRSFLGYQGVLMKDFEPFAKTITQLVCDPAERTGAKLHDKVVYLTSPTVSKEMVAQNLLFDRPIRQGPIGVLSAVEPCWTWEVHRSRRRETPQTFQRQSGKCLHYYHYFLDQRFGFLHVRVQTWFPFQVRVCMNGREWLARRLDERRMRYHKADNCFQWLASPELAQQLMDDMLRLPWQTVLDELVVAANPMLATLAEQVGSRFYWTVWQSELATDVMFKDTESLDACYPEFLRYAISNLKSPDVMRFLGRKLCHRYRGEVVSDFKRRIEGTRVKHFAQGNSIKMYNKQGNVLRIEQTTNNPGEFRVRRRAHGDPRSERCLRPLRKSVVDIKRLAAVGRASNARYLDALATVTVETPLQRLLDPLTAPAEIGGRRVRGLRPWTAPDVTLMEAVSRGEFAMNGFRSRDLLPILFDLRDDAEARRKASGKLTRMLRLFRAHCLIERVEGTYRYSVTAHGRTVIAAILAARNASVTKLGQCA